MQITTVEHQLMYQQGHFPITQLNCQQNFLQLYPLIIQQEHQLIFQVFYQQQYLVMIQVINLQVVQLFPINNAVSGILLISVVDFF